MMTVQQAEKLKNTAAKEYRAYANKIEKRMKTSLEIDEKSMSKLKELKSKYSEIFWVWYELIQVPANK